jgi:hypothetical protein
MAKHTAIRLDNSLMIAAKNAAAVHKRTAVEQIEYWAELGKNLSRFIDPETLIACSAGLATLKVERIVSPPVNPQAIFEQLERSREEGSLQQAVTASRFRYQASESYPGMLERLDANGKKTVGSFNNGVFKPLKDALN